MSSINTVPQNRRGKWVSRFTKVLPALVIFGLLGTFGHLAGEVLEGETKSFDMSILMLFRSPANPQDPIGPPWLQEAIRDITSLGSISLLTLFTVLAVVSLLIIGKRQTTAYLTACVVGGAFVSTVLKALFDRPRPDFESVAHVFSASFPSGHATLSAVVYLTLGALLGETTTDVVLKRFYIATAIVIVIVVGMSRIYMAVHYPTDVIAGWLLGTAWALLCWAGAELVLKRRKRGESE